MVQVVRRSIVLFIARTAALPRTLGGGIVLLLKGPGTQVPWSILVLILTNVRVSASGRNAVLHGVVVDVAGAVLYGVIVDDAGAVLDGLEPGRHHAEVRLTASAIDKTKCFRNLKKA